MTRRIAVAILLTVWAILVAAGIATYLVTRSVLLANLDDSLIERAAALPEITDERGNTYRNTTPIRSDDSVIVRNTINQTRGRAASTTPRPEVLSAAFVTMPDGQRFRTLTLKAYAKPSTSTTANEANVNAGEITPVTVFFRGSAERFDHLTRLLGLTLIGCVAGGGVLSALIAWLVARAALRPLRTTADVIGAIDDRALDRRIDTKRLPPELMPVGVKLNGMLERLEQAFSHRRRFLADAAHELRTPVAALVTTMEVTLRRARESDAYRQALETSLADARLLRSLVESLMTQVRSELPTFNEQSQTIDLDALTRDTIAALRALAEQRDVRLENRIGASLLVRAQPGRLRSVLLNLIGNAIEHNRPGGAVTIEANVHQANLRLSVTDTGTGIAPQHLPHVFEPFYRADKARGSGEGHLGLGLFLVKTHVEAMGGECRVNSTPGAGSTFELLLPNAVIPARSPDTLSAEERPAVRSTSVPTMGSRS
jgi:heavy metal sensor kinase